MMMKNEKAEKINQGVIHRDITDNEKETNRDNLNNSIEKFPDDTAPAEMEECGNDDKKEKTAEKKNRV